MNKFSKALVWPLGLVVGFLGFAALPQAVAAQANSPTDVARTVIAAINTHDLSSVAKLFAPGARIVTSAGQFRNTDQSFDEWSAEMSKNSATVTINTLTQTAPDTAVAEVTISGPGVPVLPHAVTDKMTFTVVNGQVTHILDEASPQTVEEIGAFVAAQGGGQPGMPATGDNNESSLAVMLALGLVAVSMGVLIRSRRLRPGRML